MKRIDSATLEKLIADCLSNFYERRFNNLEKRIGLKQILKRKNPYLLRALGVEKASEIINEIVASTISASDETMFGDVFFERIVIALGIRKSSAEGVDFEVDEQSVIHAYQLKSGPNPYNGAAKKKQDELFKALKSRLLGLHKQFDPVLAYAYGNKQIDGGKRIYREVGGQGFWKEITGDPDFYLKIMRLMKDIPQRQKQKYKKEWDSCVAKLTRQFEENFCTEEGKINWDKLTKFISGSEPPELVKTT